MKIDEETTKEIQLNFLKWNKLSKFDFKQINLRTLFNNFGSVKFDYTSKSLKGEVADGPSSFNKKTIALMAKFIYENYSNNVISISNSNVPIDIIYDFLLIFERYFSYSLVEEKIIVPEHSYFIKKSTFNNNLGITFSYLGDNQLSIKFLNNEGEQYGEDFYYKLSNYISENPIDENDTLANKKKDVTILSFAEYRKSFVEKYKTIFKEKLLINNALISYSSEPVRELIDMMNISINDENMFYNNGQFRDVVDVRSYRSSKKYAQKNKLKIIFNISPDGTQISLATRQNMTWDFYESNKQNNLFYDDCFKNYELKPKYNDVNNDIVNYSIKHNNKLDKSKATIFFTDNYEVSISKNYISYSFLDSLYLFNELFHRTQSWKIKTIINNVSKHSNYISQFNTNYISKQKYETFIRNITQETKENGFFNNYSYFISNKENNSIEYTLNSNESKAKFVYYDDLNLMKTYYSAFGENANDAYDISRTNFKTFNSLMKKNFTSKDFSSTKNLVFLFFAFLILVATLAVVFVFVFNAGNGSIINSFDAIRFNQQWVYWLILSVFVTPILTGLLFYLILKKLDPATKVLEAVIGMMIFFFVFAIVPFLYIYPLALMWYLRIRGYKMSSVVSATAISLFVFFFANTLMDTIFMVNGIIQSKENVGQWTELVNGFAIAGYLWLVFNSALYIVLAYAKWIHNLAFFGIEYSFFFLKKEKEYKRVYSLVESNLLQIQNNFNLILKNKIYFLSINILYIFYYLWLKSLFYFSVESVSSLTNYIGSWFNLTSSYTVVTLANAFMPLPGHSGTTEWALVNYSPYLIGNSEAASVAATFILRLFTFYIPTVLYGIIFIYIVGKISLKKSNSILNLRNTKRLKNKL